MCAGSHPIIYRVLTALRYRHDTAPSTFDRPISSITLERHVSKRAKLSDISGKTTITGLIESKAYTTIDQLVNDVERATSSIISELKESISRGLESFQSDRKAQHVIARAESLKKELEHLVLGEVIQRPDALKLKGNGSDGNVNDEETTQETVDQSNRSRKAVLTLYGGERQAKQLFSSLAAPNTSRVDINEQWLPNGITTTKIIPAHSLDEKDETKTAPSLGDLFPPPANLPALLPPRPSKDTATRSLSVNWYNSSEAAASAKPPNRRDGFTSALLPTGRWLTYNVAPSPTHDSPETKRKQRDRALSIGETKSAVSEEAIAAHKQAKKDALYSSVYSSFAPDRDDSLALVAEQQKNRLWWTRYGEERYQELLYIKEEELLHQSDVAKSNAVPDGDDFNEEEIKDAIENWVSLDPKADLEKEHMAGKSDTKENESLLQEISELLETLGSHQRVRNESLPTSARTSSGPGPNSQLASTIGNPSSPSSAEFDIYETLKSQLTLVISSLPPYMLAKLDGDRLKALNISTRIQVEGRNQKGSMQEEELSLKTKAAVRNTIPPTASQTASAYSNLPARSNYLPPTHTPSHQPSHQYPRTAYGGQAPVPRQSLPNSYPATQHSGRPAPPTHYPSGSGRPSYSSQNSYTPQRPQSYTERYSNGVAQQYGQLSAHTYGSYQNGYRPPLNTGASSYGPQYSTPQPRAPATASSTLQAYRATPLEYQQRAALPQAYGYGPGQAGDSASPHPPQRSPFSAQGQGQAQAQSQQRPPLYQQHSSHYGSRASTEPQTNGPEPVDSGHMSPDEQTAVMNRQKVQLGEKQNSPGSHRSSTPQPAAENHEQENGTSTDQQNGVASGEDQ